MKRKINRVGTSTLTVSIPTKWAKEHGIAPGQEIDVETKQDQLIISPNPNTKCKRTSLRMLRGNYWYANQKLRNAYIAGFDELHITFDDPVIMADIQAAVDKLIGFEIVEQHTSSCLVKAVTIEAEDCLDHTIKRIFLQMLGHFERFTQDLKTNTYDKGSFMQVHFNIHKFISFSRRMVTKRQVLTERKRHALLIILMRLQMICGNLSYMYEYLTNHEAPKLQAKTIELIVHTAEQLRLFHDLYYSKDTDGLQRLNSRRKELTKDLVYPLLEHHAGPDAIITYYGAEIIRLISTSGGSLLNLSLEAQ